jgi:3-hydroxyisobutyrate dehydrogenase-like beta-hydroxyacid dehydrogenase
MADLGFIGLGRMGSHMAFHLLRGGHTLAVYARRREAAAPIVAAGAIDCTSPADVAQRSDVIFTMLTDTAAVEAVALGRNGIVETARPGAILVDHSTISPAGSRLIAQALRERGVLMLDAPVSGGWWAAEAASLSIMVGGDDEVFTRCLPLLELMGTTITHIGGPGAGQIAKACNQICIVVTQLGVAEAVLLAERSGIDFSRVHRALMAGFAGSRVLEVQGPKMAARRFEGQVESRLHHKDALIALDAARALGLRLPAAALAAESLTTLQEDGGATLDSAAIVRTLEQSQTNR